MLCWFVCVCYDFDVVTLWLSLTLLCVCMCVVRAVSSNGPVTRYLLSCKLCVCYHRLNHTNEQIGAVAFINDVHNCCLVAHLVGAPKL